MKAIKVFSLIFLFFALLSWGVYFGIELLPVPFMRIVMTCQSPQTLEEIKSKFKDRIIVVEKTSKYVYKELPYYIVGWESENKERLSDIKEAIEKYLERRGLPYKMLLLKLGDKWLLKVKGDYKSEKRARKVQEEIYNKGNGYYLEVMKKKVAKEVKVFQITLEIPRDRLKELMDFLDYLKSKYPDDKFIEIVSSERVYKQEENQ